MSRKKLGAPETRTDEKLCPYWVFFSEAVLFGGRMMPKESTMYNTTASMCPMKIKNGHKETSQPSALEIVKGKPGITNEVLRSENANRRLP